MSGIDAPLPVPEIDHVTLRRSRLDRLRSTMEDHGLAALVLTSPVSIRYATGYRSYALFQSHIPSAYLFVPVEGPVVLFGAYVDNLETIDDVRPSHAPTAFDAGLDIARASQRWADDIRGCLADAGLGLDAVVGTERLLATTFTALAESGIQLVDGEPTVELARSRKSELEVKSLTFSIAVAEYGMGQMARHLQPGITENQLWSTLHAVNIVNDGDWFDGRMLCSGPRTNPWYQEASGREIQRGDLVAFDTDMIGPFGYCADISRTWVCGANPSAEQRYLHDLATEEVSHNTALLKVGASFAELSQQSFRHQPDIAANRYACAFHGVGMSDEYPKIPYPQDWDTTGYDGEIENGMVLSVESYVGPDHAREGVKFEQMVQVTTKGVRLLSTFPTELSVASGHAGEADSDTRHEGLQHRLRMATHDIRSKLGPIVGYADLIKISSNINQARDHAERISQSAADVALLADDLADNVLVPESDAPPKEPDL